MLSKRKKVITTLPPVFCSVVACKLFYSITERVEILSLLFVPPAEGGGMEVIMKKILSLIISLAMFLSLSITTFASDALAVASLKASLRKIHLIHLFLLKPTLNI